RPRDRGAAEQGHELAPFQLIELHSIPASQGRISGYRIGKDQSGGIRTILQPVFSPMSALGQKEKSLRRTYVVQITRKGDMAARFMSTRPRTIKLASAANPKFAHLVRQVRLRTSGSEAALEL